jgi:toxin HigB-1
MTLETGLQYVKNGLTHRKPLPYSGSMIRSFRSRALDAFWHDGDAKGIRPDLLKRLKVRLSRLDAATQPEEMNAAGFNFHRLQGKPTRYTVHVNGPWCLTFGWDGEDAVRVDLEQYH